MPSPLTKRACKSLLSSLQDLGIDQYEVVVEGNGFRVIVGNMEMKEPDIAHEIDGVA